MDLPLEIRVIKKFFKKEKQDRYIGFVSSGKNRQKFIRELSHLKDLQWNLFEEVSSFYPKQIQGFKSNQACYVISEDTSVDQTFIAVDEIHELTDSGNAFILVFGAADQMYYEGEPPFNRYMSKKH
jgi:exopolysaccharide biosynthesis protein